MPKHARLALWLVLVIMAASCAPAATPPSQAPAATLQPVSDELRSQLVGADTRFAFRLFGELVGQDAGKNVFISPVSVALALAMTYNGARGETQEAMAKTLELTGMSLDEVNQASADLQSRLLNPEPRVQLTIANSLWARKGFPLLPEFVRRNRDYYGAEVNSLDFAARSAPATINDWVKKNTGGKIDKIVGDSISPRIVLLLINAIYFRAPWTVPFDKKATQPGPFTLPDGQKLTVPLMRQAGKYQYYRGQGFQAVSLPYGEKRRVSLYIFLPDEGASLEQFYQGLSAESWARWMGEFKEAQGQIVLPRFKLQYEKSLNDTLKALGMGIAFDPARADLHGISDTREQLWIDEVKHKTVLEVHEEGTEAAATTMVAIAVSAAPGEPFTMVVDRPFFCAIRDNETGTVLFMGSIVRPEA